MEFRQIEYFVYVANEKSFTKAAKKLNISQPALSKMIGNLEHEIGSQLFSRNDKKIELTDIGTSLYEKVHKIVTQYDDVSEFVNNIKNSMEGSIIVGIPPVIGTCLFPSILLLFKETYPKINVKVVEVGAKSVENLVSEGKIDIGVCILPVDYDEYNVFPIIEDKISLAVYKDHRLAGRSHIKIDELKGEKLVILNDTFKLHHNILLACETAKFEPKIVMESLSWDFLLELVSIKHGITLLPSPIMAKYNTAQLEVIAIDNEVLKWKIVAITKKNKLLSSITKKFVTFTQKNAHF